VVRIHPIPHKIIGLTDIVEALRICYYLIMRKEEIKEKIIEAVKSSPYRDYIQSISLFGSFLRGDEKKDSDIDLLIKLKSGIGFFELFDIQQDLEKKLGRKVDLATPGGLSKYIKDEIISEAKKVYDANVSAL